MASGECKLTGRFGKFVRSHLTPRALTRLEIAGAAIHEGGKGQPTKQRWDSWYDRGLVVRAGEDRLEALDTWAIAEMRRLKLVWSGWGDATDLGEHHQMIPVANGWGHREVTTTSPNTLRLFFISLLWRWAASDLPEASDVQLPPEHVERLREMVLNNDPTPLNFYRTSLVQLSDKGFAHNHTPIRQTKTNPATETTPERKIDFIRFYFDGLIAHMDIPSGSIRDDEMSDAYVGHSSRQIVLTQTFGSSFQWENLQALVQATAEADARLRLAREPNTVSPRDPVS